MAAEQVSIGDPYARAGELGRLGTRTVALGVLDMVLSGPEWIHRRVEQIEILTATHANRRVSLDLTVPRPCDAAVEWFDGVRHPLIPLDVLAKRPLQRFSVTAEDGTPIPTLTRRQNGEIAWQGLLALATSSLRGTQRRLPNWVSPLLSRIAQDPPDDAMAAIADFEARAAVEPVARQLWEDPGLQTAAQMLAGNFLLIAMTDCLPGRRTVLKYEHEISLIGPADDARRPRERVRERFGWEPTTIEIPVPSFTDCESFHFEASAPDGIELLDIVLGDESRTEGDVVDERWALGYRRLDGDSPHRAHLATSYTADPQTAGDEFREPRVSVRLRVDRGGWLRSSAWAAALVAAFFVVSLPWVWAMDDPVPDALCVMEVVQERRSSTAPQIEPVPEPTTCRTASGVSTDPAAFTVALLSVISLAVIRVGEHAYTARMIRPLRVAALTSAVLPIVGAWLLVFPGPGTGLNATWLLLSLIAATLAVGLLCVWRRPAPA